MILNVDDYSKALFELASEENCTDIVYENLKVISGLLCENPGFVSLLDSPAVSKDERISMIDDAFSGASYITLNFLKILADMRCVSYFEKCVVRFGEFYDEANNILRAEIITAVELSDAQCEAICAKISAETGKKVVPDKKIDPSVLGGVILRYDGKQIDGSVASRLDQMRKQLADIVL